MANFYTYYSDGTMTLTMICSVTGCNKRDLYTLNSTVKYKGKSLSSYLQSLDLKGSRVPRGLSIRIPTKLTGDIDTKYSAHKSISSLLTTRQNSDTKYNMEKSASAAAQHRYFESFANRGTTYGVNHKAHSEIGTRASNYYPSQNFNCYLYTLLDGSISAGPMNIPVYPNEFSDTNNANFSSVSIFGRSVDYQIYNGSSRSVSFTLQLHEELCSNTDEVHTLVATVESACYPEYSGGAIEVPEIIVCIGNHFSIRGIVSSCSASWKAPIIDGRLVNCDLSVSILETNGPYTMSEIRRKRGYRRW